MDQKQLATVPHDLLEDIEKLYPERTPDPHMTDREIWMAVGRRQVVRNLRSIHEDQQENIMESVNVSE